MHTYSTYISNIGLYSINGFYESSLNATFLKLSKIVFIRYVTARNVCHLILRLFSYVKYIKDIRQLEYYKNKICVLQ